MTLHFKYHPRWHSGIIKVSNQHQLLEVDSMEVSWWIVVFCQWSVSLIKHVLADLADHLGTR